MSLPRAQHGGIQSLLDLQDRVNAKIKLLSYVLPKLASIDMRLQDLTVKDFIELPKEEKIAYLQTIKQ